MSHIPPVTAHERTTIEWVLDGVAVAAAICCVAIAAINYGNLPDTIPTHFGLSGEADGWGSKNFVWLLPMIALVVVPLIIYLCPMPQKFHYIGKVKAENAQSEYARARVKLRWLNAFIACLLLLLTWQITHPGANVLGPWALFAMIAAPLIFLISDFNYFFRKN